MAAEMKGFRVCDAVRSSTPLEGSVARCFSPSGTAGPAETSIIVVIALCQSHRGNASTRGPVVEVTGGSRLVVFRPASLQDVGSFARSDCVRPAHVYVKACGKETKGIKLSAVDLKLISISS